MILTAALNGRRYSFPPPFSLLSGKGYFWGVGRALKHFVVLMNGEHPAASIASAASRVYAETPGRPKTTKLSLKLLLVAIPGTNDLDLHVGEQRRHRSYSS